MPTVPLVQRGRKARRLTSPMLVLAFSDCQENLLTRMTVSREMQE
jgi:hypothetical protein